MENTRIFWSGLAGWLIGAAIAVAAVAIVSGDLWHNVGAAALAVLWTFISAGLTYLFFRFIRFSK